MHAGYVYAYYEARPLYCRHPFNVTIKKRPCWHFWFTFLCVPETVCSILGCFDLCPILKGALL